MRIYLFYFFHQFYTVNQFVYLFLHEVNENVND